MQQNNWDRFEHLVNQSDGLLDVDDTKTIETLSLDKIEL